MQIRLVDNQYLLHENLHKLICQDDDLLLRRALIIGSIHSAQRTVERSRFVAIKSFDTVCTGN